MELTITLFELMLLSSDIKRPQILPELILFCEVKQSFNYSKVIFPTIRLLILLPSWREILLKKLPVYWCSQRFLLKITEISFLKSLESAVNRGIELLNIALACYPLANPPPLFYWYNFESVYFPDFNDTFAAIVLLLTATVAFTVVSPLASRLISWSVIVSYLIINRFSV